MYVANTTYVSFPTYVISFYYICHKIPLATIYRTYILQFHQMYRDMFIKYVLKYCYKCGIVLNVQ